MEAGRRGTIEQLQVRGRGGGVVRCRGGQAHREGYAVKYESWLDVIEALGEVLVSKLGCIVKTREDGTLKVRNVLDLRRSGYIDGVQLKERIVLPRVKDLVEDVCDLKRCAGNSEECHGMVDFTGSHVIQ